MEQTQRLEREQWQGYFEFVTRNAKGEDVEVEVVDDELGAQTDIRNRRLLGISYDPNDDLLEIECEGVDHMISYPKEIFVNSEGAKLKALLVVQQDNTRQVVKLRPGPKLEM